MFAMIFRMQLRRGNAQIILLPSLCGITFDRILLHLDPHFYRLSEGLKLTISVFPPLLCSCLPFIILIPLFWAARFRNVNFLDDIKLTYLTPLQIATQFVMICTIRRIVVAHCFLLALVASSLLLPLDSSSGIVLPDLQSRVLRFRMLYGPMPLSSILALGFLTSIIACEYYALWREFTLQWARAILSLIGIGIGPALYITWII